jgi:hypothetical protein
MTNRNSGFVLKIRLTEWVMGKWMRGRKDSGHEAYKLQFAAAVELEAKRGGGENYHSHHPATFCEIAKIAFQVHIPLSLYHCNNSQHKHVQNGFHHHFPTVPYP